MSLETEEGTRTGTVFVPGTPVPQGSTKGYIVKGHVNITSANEKTMPWRADVAAHVRSVIGPRILFPTGPLTLELRFVMPRRAAEPKRSTPAHTRKPDGDKLQRAVWDALTGILYTDDAQVVEWPGGKRTAAIGEQPGVHITWAELTGPAPTE
jgi:crossover junction endodeoxyribonuclease RusA